MREIALHIYWIQKQTSLHLIVTSRRIITLDDRGHPSHLRITLWTIPDYVGGHGEVTTINNRLIQGKKSRMPTYYNKSYHVHDTFIRELITYWNSRDMRLTRTAHYTHTNAHLLFNVTKTSAMKICAKRRHTHTKQGKISFTAVKEHIHNMISILDKQ